MQTRRQEIDDLKLRVNSVTAIGHQLMLSSSCISATDIDSRLTRLLDAWTQLDNKAATRYLLIMCFCALKNFFGIRDEDFCICFRYVTA